MVEFLVCVAFGFAIGWVFWDRKDD